MRTRRLHRICRFLFCRTDTQEFCDEAQPLAQEDDEDNELGKQRRALPLQRSLWDRAHRRISQLLRFERASGFDAEADDPMPRCLLTYEQRIMLLPLLPPTLRHRRWKLLFTTSDHGRSIISVLSRAHDRGPTLVIVCDRQQLIFGAFAASPWRREPEPHFYGTGEGFLFSTWPADEGFRAWHWSGRNRFFQIASHDFVAFGSGGHFGLWLGKSLGTGSTGRCETFENEPLTQHSVHGGLAEPHLGDSAFEVREVQIWGFAEG